ncbi:hypothetical protein GW17_00003552 [Ensete ventricosum]|nr:hypothetical protein GW17_00003552 [Ensete ventricosum]
MDRWLALGRCEGRHPRWRRRTNRRIPGAGPSNASSTPAVSSPPLSDSGRRRGPTRPTSKQRASSRVI